jgi:hypothetical protein
MATEQVISDFLDQYDPDRAEESKPVEQSDLAAAFLDQHVAPEQKAQPIKQTAEPSKMSLEQRALMTHEPRDEKSQWEIRPEIVTEGIKKGFADFAALPGYAVDLVNWPLHKLGITPGEPIGSSAMIRRGWQLLTGYQELEPETRMERVGKRVGEFLGSGVVPGLGIVGKVASRGAPLAAGAKPAAIRQAFQITGGSRAAMIPRMAAPATNKELAGVVGLEVASAITGGAMAEFGGEIGEKVAGGPGRVVGELVLGMAGGMTPIYFKSAGGTIYNGIRAGNTVVKDRANFMENAAKAKIMSSIGDNPQAPANLARAQALQKEIPGFNPNLAAATDAQGLAQQQARLDSMSMENYQRALENIRKAQEAIGHYYDDLFGTTLRRLPATRTFRKTLKALKTHAQDVDKQIDDLASQYQRKPTKQIGERLRELRQVRKTQVRGDVNQAYTDLYKAADELGIVDDVGDLYIMAQDFTRQDSTAFQKMPGVYAKMRQVFGRDIDPNVPLDEQKLMADFPKMHSLSRQVSREYGKAQRAGDAQKEYYLHQVKELLDNKLQAFDDPIYGSFADHKKAVDAFWLEDYYKVFRKGVGGKIPHETRWGEVTPDEKIVSKLVLQRGTSQGIKQFNKVYADVPEAQTLLRDGILDDFASRVIPKNKIDSNEVRRYLNDYKEVFDELPDLRNTFMNSDALTNALVNRRANIVSKTKKFATESISPYAKIAGYESPHDAVVAGLKSPRIMRILTRNAKTEAERKDLTSIIADVVMDQPDPWGYITRNEDQLAKHFNRLAPGHFKKIKNIAEANQIVKRYDVGEFQPSRAAEDPFYKRFGTTFASQNAIDDLMERALYDPDLATTMSELSKIHPSALSDLKVMDLLSKVGQHSINNGIRTGVVAIPEEQPQR